MKKVFSFLGLGIFGISVFFIIFIWFQKKEIRPSEVFKIMFLGDSAIYCVAQPGGGCENDNSFVKKIGVVMNEYAESDGIKRRFKVYCLWKPATKLPVLTWPSYECPKINRKYYDVTILTISASMSDSDRPFFYPWFHMPVSGNGMPAHEFDREYLLKDARERIPIGVAGDFYKRCVGKNLAGIKNGKFWFGRFREMLQDEAVEKDLIEMFATPIGLLKERLNNKTDLYLMFFPCPANENYDDQAVFWKKVCKKAGIRLIDLTPEFKALRASSVPLSETSGYYHLNRYGHLLTMFLVTKKLRDTGVIPWD
jgi:hypothetical protein